MINPKQRKEIIILLKTLQNEEAWDKIYQYIHSVLGHPKKNSFRLEDPVAEYQVKSGYTVAWTEEEAQEILDDYNNNGGPYQLTPKQLEEIIEASEECDSDPDSCIPAEIVMKELKERYEL